MAKRLAIQSKETQLCIVGKKNFLHLPRVQRIDLSTDNPSTIIDEHGNSKHAGESKDVSNVTLTFSAMDVGVKIWSVLTGTDWTAYPAAGVDISALGEIDAILYNKSDTVADYSKTIHARRLRVRDVSLSYSADGDSTEDYTFVGSKKRYLNYDVIVDRFVTGTTSFTLTQTPRQLKNGNYVISVILDGNYLTESTGTLTTGQYSINAGTKVLTTFDTMVTQLLVVYHADPAGTNWTDISDSTMPASIRGRDVVIKILANSIPRVQSVTVNGTLNITPVNEMGNKDKIAGYTQGVPDITGTISVLDTDNELVNMLSEGTVTISGVEEWSPGEGCATLAIPLTIELLDPCDDTFPYTVLKTVHCDSISVTGDSWSSNINGNATTNFNWRSTTGSLIVYSGAMA